jgi:hypothetical protein
VLSKNRDPCTVPQPAGFRKGLVDGPSRQGMGLCLESGLLANRSSRKPLLEGHADAAVGHSGIPLRDTENLTAVACAARKGDLKRLSVLELRLSRLRCSRLQRTFSVIAA